MANTLSGFTTFTARTLIQSSQVNTNFDLLKQHSPVWHVYTLTTSDFSFAGNTNTGTLFNADPKEVIHGYYAKHSTAFSGGSVSGITFSLGIATDRAKYVDAFNIFQAVSSGASYLASDFDLLSFDATTPVTWMAVASGSTLDSLSAGTLEVYILKSNLP